MNQEKNKDIHSFIKKNAEIGQLNTDKNKAGPLPQSYASQTPVLYCLPAMGVIGSKHQLSDTFFKLNDTCKWVFWEPLPWLS